MSALALGNEAARDGKPDIARQLYATALLAQPVLAEVIFGNLLRLHRHPADLRDSCPVVVAGYELGHNAAGRAAVLAELYSRAGHEVLLLGPTVAPYRDLWAPIRQSPLRRRLCALESFSDVLTGLIPLVASQPASVVHVSKSRGPNLLTGALYKLFWNATVLIDVDDEELGFVGAASPISFAEWATLPEIAERPLSYGAYVVKEWNKGQSIVLEANPYYEGTVATPNVIYVFVADTNQAVAQLLNGDVDYLDDSTLGAGAEVQTVIDAANSTGNVQYEISPSSTWEHIDINLFTK